MEGYGNNQVILSPNHMVGIVIGKAWEGYVPKGEKIMTDEGQVTIRDMLRLAP
jgi:hypothetical protein